LPPARELALAETGIKIGDNTVGGFDTFAAEEGRRAHLAGEIPAAIGEFGASGLPTTNPLVEQVAIAAVK
jgi:hypothetical protein